MPTTSWPSASSRSLRCDPMKPAAPVTIAFMWAKPKPHELGGLALSSRGPLNCGLATAICKRSYPLLVVRPGKRSPIHRPRRPGFADACVAFCARSVTHLRDALPHVLVGSLAPAAEAAPWRADPGADH